MYTLNLLKINIGIDKFVIILNSDVKNSYTLIYLTYSIDNGFICKKETITKEDLKFKLSETNTLPVIYAGDCPAVMYETEVDKKLWYFDKDLSTPFLLQSKIRLSHKLLITT